MLTQKQHGAQQGRQEGALAETRRRVYKPCVPVPRLLTGEGADSEKKLKGSFAQLELNMALGKSPEPLFFRL